MSVNQEKNIIALKISKYLEDAFMKNSEVKIADTKLLNSKIANYFRDDISIVDRILNLRKLRNVALILDNDITDKVKISNALGVDYPIIIKYKTITSYNKIFLTDEFKNMIKDFILFDNNVEIEHNLTTVLNYILDPYLDTISNICHTMNNSLGEIILSINTEIGRESSTLLACSEDKEEKRKELIDFIDSTLLALSSYIDDACDIYPTQLKELFESVNEKLASNEDKDSIVDDILVNYINIVSYYKNIIGNMVNFIATNKKI